MERNPKMTKSKKTIKKYTALEVADRFEEAVYTLKRLPPVRVQGHFNAWPKVIRSTAERLQEQKEPMRLPPPQPAAISRMEECLEWVLSLNETERDLVWMRAKRTPWKTICRHIGYRRTKAWELYTIALLKIVTRLNTRLMAGLDVRTKNY